MQGGAQSHADAVREQRAYSAGFKRTVERNGRMYDLYGANPWSHVKKKQYQRVAKAMRQAGAAASGMARAAARAVWTMLGGRHVEETTEKSGPPRAGDHGEPGEAATGDG